jgi:hypothetical protein
METLKYPAIPETGPRPLTNNDIELNSINLKFNKVRTSESKPTFNNFGIFSVEDDFSRNYSYFDDSYWSQELMTFDPEQHIIQTSKYGNLKVYETKGEIFLSAQNKPKIIIEAKDVRKIDKLYTMKGEVRPSGFVLPKLFPPYPLGHNQRISPEELEQMLLTAQKNDKPESSYTLEKGFAKVDPSFANKDVLLIPFDILYRDVENIMQTDAIVIDLAERKLIPRVFYNLAPKELGIK